MAAATRTNASCHNGCLPAFSAAPALPPLAGQALLHGRASRPLPGMPEPQAGWIANCESKVGRRKWVKCAIGCNKSTQTLTRHARNRACSDDATRRPPCPREQAVWSGKPGHTAIACLYSNIPVDFLGVLAYTRCGSVKSARKTSTCVCAGLRSRLLERSAIRARQMRKTHTEVKL